MGATGADALFLLSASYANAAKSASSILKITMMTATGIRRPSASGDGPRKIELNLAAHPLFIGLKKGWPCAGLPQHGCAIWIKRSKKLTKKPRYERRYLVLIINPKTLFQSFYMFRKRSVAGTPYLRGFRDDYDCDSRCFPIRLISGSLSRVTFVNSPQDFYCPLAKLPKDIMVAS
ncbi:MAG: hypothetical protein HC843_08405 [Sphingomonadales bacterium]|nr:hypothetical protein [Sphingomonadales bacterium]